MAEAYCVKDKKKVEVQNPQHITMKNGKPPILKTLPPHTGHVPCVAGLPFFIVIFCGFWTSTFFLSLTQ